MPSGVPSSRPSSSRSTRSQAAASRGLCVAMTDVRPRSRCMSRSRSCSDLGGVLVEVAGRLVREQQRGFHDQRARDRDALLLAARQHPRPMLEPLAEPDPRQQARRARLPLRRRPPRDAHRHLGVLERGELRQQVMELEHEADVPVPERDELRVGSDASSALADPDRCPRRPRSSPPSTCSSVLFPTPDAPTIATISPCSRLEVEPAQHRQLRAADRVALG